MNQERSSRSMRRATALAPLLLALLMAWPAGATFGVEATAPPPPQEDGWRKLVAYGSCALGIAASVWHENGVGLAQALVFCGIKLDEEKS